MPPDPDMLTLARAVLAKNRADTRDTARDSHGTSPENLSQGAFGVGTANSAQNQTESPTVPLSQALGDGTVGHPENHGTPVGTVAGQHYVTVLAALRSACPELIETDRWHQAVKDSECFLATWAAQAHALGWTARELFGLHPVPARPAPTYRRLSRYDATGLIWLLCSRPVIALAAAEAAIQSSGAVVVYRKHRKPARRLGHHGGEVVRRQRVSDMPIDHHHMQ